MALPGLYLPPYIVFRKNVPRMLFSCSELVFCSRLSLTHTHSGVHTSCRWQRVLAAEPAPWWGVDTGLCRPPRGLPSCQFSGQALGVRSQRSIGAVPWGRGTVSLLTRTLMPSSLQGAAPPVCL